jgi:hypothetical protein
MYRHPIPRGREVNLKATGDRRCRAEPLTPAPTTQCSLHCQRFVLRQLVVRSSRAASLIFLHPASRIRRPRRPAAYCTQSSSRRVRRRKPRRKVFRLRIMVSSITLAPCDAAHRTYDRYRTHRRRPSVIRPAKSQRHLKSRSKRVRGSWNWSTYARTRGCTFGN